MGLPKSGTDFGVTEEGEQRKNQNKGEGQHSVFPLELQKRWLQNKLNNRSTTTTKHVLGKI